MSGILVVDDHPVIAKACGVVLDPIWIEKIFSAFDVDTGYQAFLEHKPDVSVVDLSLGGKSFARSGRQGLVFSMHTASRAGTQLPATSCLGAFWTPAP
jgi:DNA-binding NarL/FixJ family response regulator